jgi:hypothetical protein
VKGEATLHDGLGKGGTVTLYAGSKKVSQDREDCSEIPMLLSTRAIRGAIGGDDT